MSVTGITGIGTKFQRQSDETPGNFETVARVFNISGPSMSRETVDTTTYDSTGGYREKIGGLRDGGTVTFSMNYNREGYLLFKQDFEDDQPKRYQIILPDDDETTLTFSGLVTELPLTVPEGDR